MSFCFQPQRTSPPVSSTEVESNGIDNLLAVETRSGSSSSVGFISVDDLEPMEEDFPSVSAASIHPASNKTIGFSPAVFQLDDHTTNFRFQSPPFQISCDVSLPQKTPERNVFCRTPPLICEHGPSAPSSPTSPGGCHKPNSLHVDALQRFDLLSPNFVPGMDYSKLFPLSPSHPTSDLGSSPRSSISIAQSGVGAHWTSFRDFKKLSSDYDPDSDVCFKDLFSPGTILSPAPVSPLSDCGESETPYSQRSPNLSPMPVRSGDFYFGFEQLRSRSSMSNRAEGYINSINSFDLSASLLDGETRGRSRSESEMLKAAKDEMDTNINCSTVSVPVSNRTSDSQKRSLTPVDISHVSEAHERLKHFHQSNDSVTYESTGAGTLKRFNTLSSVEGDDQELFASVSTQVSRQPTIEEPPPDPTFEEIFRCVDLDSERSKQVEDWLKQQAAAIEILRSFLAPVQQDTSNLLRVPGATPINPALLAPPQVDMHELAKLLAQGNALSAQQRRRCHSETDVSVSSVGPTSIYQELAFVCEHCGQAFALHDRLAKHIASRHRDRSASVNDESTKAHKCTICPKSFGRSDMLTRHMRLHTGVKPYSCIVCGQVFSRSDHLSTHQRTHTGEKPYRCPHCCYSASRRDMITRHMRAHLRSDDTPILSGTELQMNLSNLSINSKSPLLTPEPQALNQPLSFPTTTTSLTAKSIEDPGFQVPKLTTQATVSNGGSDNVAFTNAYLSSLINSTQQQIKLADMGRSLNAQITSEFLRHSTPNLPSLLGIPERPLPIHNFQTELAAVFSNKINPFMVPSMSQLPQPDSLSPTPSTATTSEVLNAAIAVAAQQQHLNLLTPTSTNASGNSTLPLPPGLNLANGSSLLTRQSSIGGFGFS